MDDFLDAEDERRILRLCAQYCHYFSHGLAEDFAALFTPEGRFTRLYAGAAQHGNFGNPAGSVQGTADLTALVRQRAGVFRNMVRHHQTDIVVRPGKDGDHAVAKSYMLVTDWRDGPGKLTGTAEVYAEFARTAAGWRFQSITLATHPRAPDQPERPLPKA